GYVTNASSGLVISGVTVTTNTSQSTSTNGAGYYSFTLSNGTYLITASKSGYSDNSISVPISGADNTTANITLTPTPAAVSGKILVATNRYVILDDPGIGTAGPNFSNPGMDYTIPTANWNYWSGKNTRINATVLYIDNNGFPVNGQNITFTLYNPGGGVNATNYSTTNSFGLANVSFDLNGTEYYGKWQVKAGNGTLNDSTTFIYNWWGCATSYSTCGNDATHFGANPTTQGTTTANSPYLNGGDPTTSARTDHQNYNCTICHQSFDGLPGGNTLAANHTDNTSDVHRNVSGGCRNANCHGDYTTHNTNQVIGSCYNASGGCHGNGSAWDRKDLSNKSTLSSPTVASALSLYSINSTSFNATFHTPNSTIPCIICHGPMHNITKPDESLRFIRNNNTEDSQCKTCHSSYTEHNSSNTTSGGVNCTLCHSDDVHDIQVFAQNATYIDLNHDNPNPARGNCTNCHQNATFSAALEAQPKAGNYTGRNPPQVAVPLEHSNDPSAGAKWKQTYWTNSQQLTWCIYCHGDTKHSSIALGRPANWDGNNIVNSTIGNTTWCASCHYQGYANGSNTYSDMANAFTGAGLLVPPEISGNAAYGANQSIYEYNNHSLYTSYYSNMNDSACDRCHGYNYPFTTITQLVHNQSRVGGANCADCHDIGGIALLAHVNVTTANDTSAIHKNLNINAAHVLNTTVYYDNNKRCWACHGNGTEPSTPNAHPTSYKMPDNCTDCHIQSATQNFNFTPNNTLLNVSEHYWNASDIRASVSACYACHNKSEMLLSANDPDNGSGAVYGGLNGGNNSTSHYGKKRSDLRIGISANCSYCHQNTSTAFAVAMLDSAYNSSLGNHSTYSSNPDCTSSQCHNPGWIHNSTLTKPGFTLPNNSFCLSCHGDNGTGGTNYSGAVTGIKSRHNNSLNCTDCHINSTRSIHPVRYLQAGGTTWDTSRTNAVNCTSCHQTGLNNFSSAPRIPVPLNHSINPYAGTLWNGSQPSYWTNTSQQSSCDYCHGRIALHNNSGLGNITRVQGSNIKKQSLDTSRWCANCHYNNTPGYAGNQFTPQPPEVLNQSGLVPAKSRDGTTFTNHSSYFSSGYNDSVCKNCHNNNLAASATSLNFSHNVAIGSGGSPNCIQCHNIVTGLSGGAPVGVNFTAINLSVHYGINSQNATNWSYAPVIGACWACHDTAGNVSTGHPDIYKTPKICTDCHLANSTYYNQSVKWGLNVTVSEHYYSGDQIVAGNSSSNISSCINCHENVSEMIIYNNDTNYGSFTGDGVRLTGGNMSFYHYGKDRSDIRTGATANCTYCHRNTSTAFNISMSDPVYSSNVSNHSVSYSSTNPACTQCHNTGWIHNSTLTKPNLTLPNSSYCLTCHGTPGNSSTTIKNLSQHNGT
ncbi:MAG: cytochrome c3 family protein, partial [Dehalococcoidales bacterium]|nr:cytochrome c3 family protein [Dehalococcoidales bacterium]